MTLRTIPALACTSFLAAIAGCGGGPQCVIDTDCEFGFRCASDQTCQPIGGQIDSGARDAGSRDTGTMADAPRDAPTMPDAGSCPDVAGTYTVTTLAGCAITMPGGVLTVRPDSTVGACAWTLMNVSGETPTGSIPNVTSSRTFMGAMLTVGPAPLECVGQFMAGPPPTASITCLTGGAPCMISLTGTGP
jgi:hypothetical protein